MNDSTPNAVMGNTTDFEAEASLRRALAPSNEEIGTARFGSNRAITRELLSRKGKYALDVGCGDGKLTRVLAECFETVAGIDVNEQKVAEARKAAEAAGLSIQFRAGSGEAIPFPDGSFDVVVFSNILHHITDMDRALREAGRVLVQNGLLYIMEPVPAGNFFEATRLVSDETVVKTAAYRAIGRALRNGFIPITEVMYRSRRELSDFEEWRADQIERDESRRLILETHGVEARKLFEENAERHDGRLVFDQVFRVNLLHKTQTSSA